MYTRQLDCSSSEEGIASLKEHHKDLIEKGPRFDKANEWLDNEDEILAKVPCFTREQVKV